MDCFICSGSSNPYTGQGIFIEGASAKFTGNDITSTINHLVGNAFSVVIDANDTLCCNCYGLIGELDRFRHESIVLEQILQRHINRKYKLGDFYKVLLSIDSIALLSFNVQSNGQHECKECGKVVQYLDEIAAHYKYHQLFIENIAAVGVTPKNDVFKKDNLVYMGLYDIKDESKSVSDSKFQLDDEYDFQDYSSMIIEEEQSSSTLQEILPDDVIDVNQEEDYLEEIGIDQIPLSAENEDTDKIRPTRPFQYKCTKCSYVSPTFSFLYLPISKQIRYR